MRASLGLISRALAVIFLFNYGEKPRTREIRERDQTTKRTRTCTDLRFNGNVFPYRPGR
jgi:hypothetical protein